MRAEFYFEIAPNDDTRQSDATTKLERLSRPPAPATIEVYAGNRHGSSVKDMLLQDARPT
jgi:hypothetical protein